MRVTLLISAEQYTISWAPNPREHVHGPAVSGDETYTLRLYDETDTLRRTVTGITGNSYTWSTEAADSGFTGVAATALLHFDGVNDSTSIIDDVGSTWTANGDTKIKTAQSKFGGSSLGGGPGASANNVGSGINGIAAGDFTLEAWVYLSTSGETLYPFIIGDDATGRCQLFIYNRRLVINPDYGSSDVYLNGTSAVPLTVWTHITYVRKSGVIKGYVNGVTDGASLANANSLGNANGVRVNTGSTGSFVDELRYINGSAVYDGNFTPPDTPFSLVGRLQLQHPC